MVDTPHFSDDWTTIDCPKEPVVYVTENLRDAEVLAYEFGYAVIGQEAVRLTPLGATAIQEFVVVPNRVSNQACS